jgi:hypothetical protein
MGGGEPTTFVSYDFYEHDTEVTPLKTSAAPVFAFSSQVGLLEVFFSFWFSLFITAAR